MCVCVLYGDPTTVDHFRTLRYEYWIKWFLFSAIRRGHPTYATDAISRL